MANNDPDLGAIFLELAPMLHVYQNYVDHYAIMTTKVPHLLSLSPNNKFTRSLTHIYLFVVSGGPKEVESVGQVCKEIL